MQAVCNRAYPAANVIFDTAKKLSISSDTGVLVRDKLMSMVYPTGSSLLNIGYFVKKTLFANLEEHFRHDTGKNWYIF